MTFSWLDVYQHLSWLTKNPYLLFSFPPFFFLAVVASLYHFTTTDTLSFTLISLHPHLQYWLPFQHISPFLCEKEERCGDENSATLLYKYFFFLNGKAWHELSPSYSLWLLPVHLWYQILPNFTFLCKLFHAFFILSLICGRISLGGKKNNKKAYLFYVPSLCQNAQ